MALMALRGATTATENSAEAILSATRELMEELVRANDLRQQEIISALFTMTPDLDAAFPARAAREMGWTSVALLDAQQPRVKGDVSRCIRVLVHVDRAGGGPARHIYLRAARSLRADLQ